MNGLAFQTQYCAYMHANPHNVGFWEDDVCTKSYNYLCITHVGLYQLLSDTSRRI